MTPLAPLEVGADPECRTVAERTPTWPAFVFIGIIVGSALGLSEALLLFTRPHYSAVGRPDLSSLIFLAAPSVDLLTFAFLGLIFGYLGEKAGGPWMRGFGAVGIGVAGGFATTIIYLRFWWDDDPRPALLGSLLLGGGAIISVLASTLFRIWERQSGGFSPDRSAAWLRGLRKGAIGVTAVLICSIGVYESVRSEGYSSTPPPVISGTAARPNIILITIDTATAGHFSCYGYARHTTPNIDRLAQQGVQFDNAIAPSSWTLPSFASLFTGLYPHQHGAGFQTALPSRFRTLAAALHSAGYQTAGFNANLAYGQTSEGIARGFDVYYAGAHNLRQNLVQTLVGRVFTKYIQMRFIKPERPERENAEEINRQVLHWFSRRTTRPYFLFINYFDVHAPYLAPPPFAKRYGELQYDLVRKFDSRNGRTAMTPKDRASLMAGYDNTLAYTDGQIGRLLGYLAQGPDWSNTIVIITADHGETFGQHGVFTHGMNLWRELVHVPLIISGPGVPAGIHISHIAGTRRLFTTIRAFAGDTHLRSSTLIPLQNFWNGKPAFGPNPAIVSEVSGYDGQVYQTNISFLSVFTPEWHWIVDAQNNSQLYNWVADPDEKTNLAGTPQAASVVEGLRKSLGEQIRNSPRPWDGLAYLQPVGLGSSSARSPRDSDLLDSLPYQ